MQHMHAVPAASAVHPQEAGRIPGCGEVKGERWISIGRRDGSGVATSALPAARCEGAVASSGKGEGAVASHGG
jgi:hypothetical protein